jgi:PAS domain S-box-containing protein
MIGAYRDSEVDQIHPFIMALNDITGVGVAARTIVLENLQPEDVRQLIQESLAASTADGQILTDLVYKKTQGNAFFTRQFLLSLYEEGWLRFDFNTRRWTWKIAQIEAQNITDNVVDLMAGKLKKLSPETARLLQLAACMGNEFDLRTLGLIAQTSGPAALRLLSEALTEGLIFPMDNYYNSPEMAIQGRFSFLHDIPKARLLAAVTMQLLEERYHSDSPISPLSLIIGGFIRHRHDHLKSTLPIFAEGVQKGLATGNFQFVGYCAWWHAWHFLFTGAPLAKVEAVSRQAEETCKKVQMRRLQDWCLLVQQVSLNLEGKSAVPWILTGEAYDEQEKLALAFQLNDLADLFRIFLYKAWLHYLFGQWRPAVKLFHEAESYLPNATGHYFIPLLYLYDTLAHAALADNLAADEVPQILERIDRNLAQLEVWVRFAPMNHQHKKDLMEAEKARLEGRYWDAVTLYEKAIQGARDNEFLNEEALAYELCGKFWTERGNLEIAEIFLGKAHDAYRKWGAAAKAEQLQTVVDQALGQPQPLTRDVSYALELAQPAGQSPSASWLDINSLLKASQALSQTVQLPDLLAKMIEVLLENAGAERVLVLYRDGGEWFIGASGQVRDPAIQTGLRLPVAESACLSPSVFNYVINSGKAIVLENASQDPQFGAEAYVHEHETRSVLCLPIYHKGQLSLVLYLENNLTESAFTENRLEFLQLLSGQMAISLENALMYDSLKTSIAERKRAEQTLKESEEHLRLALQGTYDGIWDWNVQSGEAYFSPRYYTMMGYELNEFPATYERWRQLLHPDDREPSERAVRRAVERHSRFAIEFRFKAKNGEWRWILSRGKVAESDDAGKAVRVAGSHTDITERKRAEEETRRLRNYLSNIINSMPSVLVGVDLEGRVTQWNAAAERATGIRAEEAQGQPLDRVLPMLRDQLARVRQAMHARTVETEAKLPRLVDGETRYEDVTVYPLMSNGVEGAVIRVDDVTERVRIEEMMVQSEKMLSVGGLAAGMAHEINNPLGVILQASQNILRRVSPELPINVQVSYACGISLSSVRQYLEQREILTFLEDIRQSGQRAAQIVANMLSFSRKSEGGGSSTDLAELLDRTVSLAASDYDLKKNYDFRQIEIVREYQPKAPRVVCQASKIQQVFLNILRNGAEAMREAGGGNRAPRFTLRVCEENAAARVEIEDNGPGMDEAIRRRVFEPFFTTKPPGLGTGLGLSVSYFIVTEDHGGAMWVESNPGAGTRFVVRLPLSGKVR